MAETITLRAYLDELNGMLEQEAPAEVISHCRHILRHFPQNIDTYRLLAKALLEKGHHENLEEHFAEAEEVFRRVLGAVPHDYVAHLGLSEICNRREELDQAIWHLERAYEQMPGNAMLQDALRELYVRRDGEEHAPTRVQLTRGALARQYMNGQLYDQAAAELRAALAQHPDRVDLQVLLAEALWSGWHEVEAGEAAVRVLKSLPNCLAANRILAQLWLDNERPTDARPFLDRVEALDPYAAAEIVQPGVESFDHVELERLDYYAQSQAELSAQTPGWVHDLEAAAGTGDLWNVPLEGAGHDQTGSAFDPAHLDMAALFAAEFTDEQGDDSALPSWPADWPPEPDAEWGEEAPAHDEVLSEPVSTEDVPPEIGGAGEPGDAAIEADWLSVTDELRAAAGDGEGQILQGGGAPGQDARADLNGDDDLLASLGIFDAEWGAADEIAAGSLASEDVARPGAPPVSEDEMLASEADAGIAVPAAEEPTGSEDTALGDAAFIDQLGEPPDFELPGPGDMEWPGVLAGVGDEAPPDAGSERSPAEQLADGESVLVTDDELHFLDQSIPTDTGWEAVDSESDRDDFDRALQGLFAASELLPEAADLEAVTAPEWLPSWEEDGGPDGEADRPAGSSEALQLDEWFQGEEASLPGETLPGEHVIRPEAPADESGGESPFDVEEPMAWMADVADVGQVVDAELLEALAVAGQAETGSERDESTGAQPAVDLPDWILEAAPLSERPPDDEPEWTVGEESALMAAETTAVGAEVESGHDSPELAGRDAFEAGQELDWLSAGDLIEEGAAGAESGDRDWLDSHAQPPTESQPEWPEVEGMWGASQEWHDERAERDASPAAGDEAAGSWDQVKAAEDVEETEADQPAPDSWVVPAGEPEDSLSGSQPAESTLEEQWSVGAETAGTADGGTPAWLEGMLGEDAEGIAGELAVEDLAALLDERYDPYEDRGPQMAPHYGSARETGILQPDERPDWMAAFTGEEVPRELDERVEALLSGEPGTADRTALDRAASSDAIPGIEDLAPAMDSGYDEGEPALAYDTEFPYGFGVSAEEGDIPSWLLAIADSEADKLDELFAGEAASEELQTRPEVARSAEEDAGWPGQDAVAEDAQGYIPQEMRDADSAGPVGGEEFAAGGGRLEEEAPFTAEAPSLGEATPLADLAEGEWSAQFDGGSDALWDEEEGVASEPEPDGPDAAMAAEVAAESAGGLPDDFDDEPVPDDFSFGDWLPIWLREPLEGGRDRSLGLRPDEPSEPPEWLRDVSEDGQ